MKILLIAALLLAASANAITLNADFIQGFETGFFLRGKPHMLNEYGCEQPEIRNPDIQKLNAIIEPLKLTAAFLPDKTIKDNIETIQIFLNEVTNLLAVFEGYSSGDYCQGLIFGMTGADMLTKIAHTAVLFAPKK